MQRAKQTTKHYRRWLLTLSLLCGFVFAQVLSQVHDIEHPFHDYQVSCEAFLVLNDTDSACDHAIEPSLPIAGHYFSNQVFDTYLSQNLVWVHPIRGPPSISYS